MCKIRYRVYSYKMCGVRPTQVREATPPAPVNFSPLWQAAEAGYSGVAADKFGRRMWYFRKMAKLATILQQSMHSRVAESWGNHNAASITSPHHVPLSLRLAQKLVPKKH